MTSLPASAAALERARRHSPFLALLLDRQPVLAEALAAGGLPSWEDLVLDPALPVGVRLRRERRAEALAVAIGDLAGALPLEAVCGRLSRFADHALDTAIRAAIAERTPDAEPAGFVAIALGKHGSGELNYSSDIDPILLYDPDTLPHRPREAVEEAAVRIARRVVELLQARDGEGYVLRVDLRLRPSPEVTPIALPIVAAISYYESQALAWERAAFVRARAAAGDLALGRQFLEAIRPFIWRRGRDFGAIAEVRAITARIRDHHAQGQALGPGYDLKRGRGGIREVEFFAQVHQLIHGGRDPALRAPATLDALARLAEAGWIGDAEAATLANAYRTLRTIEHRLQMVDDRQTHSLPAGAALDNVAALHGLDSGAGLVELLRPQVTATGRIYDTLAPPASAALSTDPVWLAEELARAGIAGPGEAAALIERWRAGGYAALRSPAARDALEAVLPGLVAAFGQAADSRAALISLDLLLAKLPSAVNFLRLLEAQPPLTRLLADILSHAPPLAEALGRRPVLLDGLIDASALQPMLDDPAAEMRRGEPGDDYQAMLDRVRQLVGERRFALGVQIVAGTTDPLIVGQGYARLAEAAMAVLAEATVEDFARTHGRVPDSELVVLALGRLGGGALTHASDLDLIYLFTGDFAAESDGARPLGAVHYYNRLAQRVSAALSVPTAAGPLYQVDTRLRPSGTQGPLSVSLAGFERYQRESAWTWEHMALTRARPIFGAPLARAAVEAAIATVLTAPRDRAALIADAAAMRAEMARHKPPLGPLDAKLLPGGLVDLEFTVHVTQLALGRGVHPDLGAAIPALGPALPAGLAEAYRFLTRLLVVVRLLAPDATPPGAATWTLIARALDLPDQAAVLARLDRTRQEVSAAWAAVTKG